MVLRLGTLMVMVVALASRSAGAQTLGEATATTGMVGTLAKSGTMNPAGTIASVKNALGKAVATKEAQLATLGTQSGWGGKGGGASAWLTSGASGGWATRGGSSGWMMASASGGGWGGGKGSAWASGAWGGH